MDWVIKVLQPAACSQTLLLPYNCRTDLPDIVNRIPCCKKADHVDGEKDKDEIDDLHMNGVGADDKCAVGISKPDKSESLLQPAENSSKDQPGNSAGNGDHDPFSKKDLFNRGLVGP